MSKDSLTPRNPFIASEYRFIEKVVITPTLAQYLLDKYNPYNVRDWTYTGVTKIVQSILANHWRSETGHCILFDCQGNLIDGQHRLQAIVESKKSIETSVCVGIRDNPYSGYGGVPRQDGTQMAKFLGEGKDAAPRIGRTLRIAEAWLRNTHPKSKRWDMETVWGFAMQHRDPIEKVLENGIFRKTKSVGFRAACAIYFAKSPTKAKSFFYQMIGESGNVKHSACIALREWLLTNKHGGGKRANDAIYIATAGAIHAFQFNQKVSSVNALPPFQEWAF